MASDITMSNSKISKRFTLKCIHVAHVDSKGLLKNSLIEKGMFLFGASLKWNGVDIDVDISHSPA